MVNAEGTASAPIGLNDLEIPKAIIQRQIKKYINGKQVQKDAKTAFTKAVTVFISYLTTAAQQVPSKTGKTLSSPQIMTALETVGLTELLPFVEQKIADHQMYLASKSNDKKAKEGLEEFTVVDGTGNTNISESIADNDDDEEEDVDEEVEDNEDLGNVMDEDETQIFNDVVSGDQFETISTTNMMSNNDFVCIDHTKEEGGKKDNKMQE